MAAIRRCEICKQPIDAERAEALPDTRLCTPHAIEIKEYGGEFITVGEQERTNKAGSLKRNYGAVTTSKQRNQRAVDRLKEAFQDSRNE
jgi:hypothetical protein